MYEAKRVVVPKACSMPRASQNSYSHSHTTEVALWHTYYCDYPPGYITKYSKGTETRQSEGLAGDEKELGRHDLWKMRCGGDGRCRRSFIIQNHGFGLSNDYYETEAYAKCSQQHVLTRSSAVRLLLVLGFSRTSVPVPAGIYLSRESKRRESSHSSERLAAAAKSRVKKD